MKRSLFIVLFSLSLLAHAWELPVKIDDSREGYYGFTQVRFDSTQTAYILYTAGNDVMFAKYDGEKVEVLKEIGESSMISCTPWMFIDENDLVHIVWAEAEQRLSNDYFLRYRTYNGTEFSPISTIIQLYIPGNTIHQSMPPKTDPLRMIMDKQGNMFIVFMDATKYKSKFISKYGDVVKYKDFPAGGKSKFPDVAVDNDYVHVTWQAGLGASNPDGGYTVFWGRKENKVDGAWLEAIDIKEGMNWDNSSHWPLVTQDENGKLHFIWQDDGESGARIIFYKYWDGTRFKPRENVSGMPHYVSNNSLRVKDENNVFVAGHMREIFTMYAWKRNGVWSVYQPIPNVAGLAPDTECADVTSDFKVALVSFSSNFASAYLVASDKFTATQRPVAVISTDKDSIYWNDEVRFDSAGSKDPDGTIVKWEWRIIEDNVTLEGPIVHYRFNKNFGTVNVKLIVTDDKGGTGSATKAIQVQPLHPVITTNVNEIFWHETLAFKGHDSSDADPTATIVRFQWDFGDGASAEGVQVSHTYTSNTAYGDLPVKLTVTNNKNAAATATKIIKVKPGPFPVINADKEEILWQDTVVFDGSRSLILPGFTVKYSWDFGDGEYAEGMQVSHKFANANAFGDKPVKLTIIDNKNVSVSATKIIKVKALYTAHTTFEKRKIRTILYNRWGYFVSWTANVKNTQAGYNIVSYKIFRSNVGISGDYSEIGQADTARSNYTDMSIDQTSGKEYQYAVCPVDAQGHYSPVDNF